MLVSQVGECMLSLVNLPIIPHNTVLHALGCGAVVKAMSLVRRLYNVNQTEAASYVALYLP